MFSSSAKLWIVLVFSASTLFLPNTGARLLGEDGDYMEDDQGNRYETYSLSWRFLGLYIDCDMDLEGGGRRRQLEENECIRKVMWAAYHDPEYQGFSIGEYQFFDWTRNEWDESTCQTERCAKMDCHLPDTRYQLLGIFTETDGLNDWAEQLFKHQGYCLWDGDKEEEGQDNEEGDYNFMQEQRENWSRDCEKGDVSDKDGNSLYVGVKPLPYGQMTYGIYSDESCIVEVDMTIRDYMLKYYLEEKGYSSAEAQYYVADYLSTIKRWNALMHDYRTCQPCRAYNKVNMNGQQNNRRSLNDGNGDNEMWGYDCYDDAGYTNCNQCYKFGSQTDMEAATLDDLRRASLQGSIMEVDVDGVMYGGIPKAYSYRTFSLSNPQVILLIVCVCLISILFLCVSWKLLCNRIVRCFRRVRSSEALNEKLHTSDDAATDIDDSTAMTNPYQKAADDLMEEIVEENKKDRARILLGEMESSVSERENEITNLEFRLDMERTKFSLERQRMTERMEQLQQQLSEYQKGRNDDDV